MSDTEGREPRRPRGADPEHVLLLAGQHQQQAAVYCREHPPPTPGVERAQLRVLAGHAASAHGADPIQREESGVVVAVGGRTRSNAGLATGVAADWTPATTLPARGTLHEVGETVDRYVVGWAEAGYRPAACVDSLTGLLEHTTVRGVFRFLYVLLHRARSVGADVHVHADPDAYDEEIVRTFYPLFDRVESTGESAEH